MAAAQPADSKEEEEEKNLKFTNMMSVGPRASKGGAEEGLIKSKQSKFRFEEP